MWTFPFLGIEFYRVFYCFFIYCFVGWIWECCYCSVIEGKLINRGFLNGPVIPIYGCAATLIFLGFYNPYMVHLATERSVEAYVTIYVLGAVIASLLEYITSYSMEKMFHAKWWDYSHLPLNIHGRICLLISLFWGLASVFLVKVLHPLVLSLIDVLPRTPGEVAGYAIIVIFIADIVSTVIATVHLDQKITYIQKLRAEFFEFTEEMKKYEMELRNDFKDKFGDTTVGEIVDLGMSRMDATIAFKNQEKIEKKEIKANKRKARINKIDIALGKNKVRMDAATEEVKRRMESVQMQAKELFNEHVAVSLTSYSQKAKAFWEKYSSVAMNGFQKFTLKRLTKAFPNMTVKDDRQGAFLDAKEEAEGKNKNN